MHAARAAKAKMQQALLQAISANQSRSRHMFFTLTPASDRLRPTRYAVAYVDPAYCRCRLSSEHRLHCVVTCDLIFHRISLSMQKNDSISRPILLTQNQL